MFLVIVGLIWLAVAIPVALIIGQAIRIADRRERRP